MGTVTVAIYERVKFNSKWTRVHVLPPQGRKRDGKLFLKDDRQGKFQLSWYEDRQKQWQQVKSRVSDRKLPYPSDAVTQAEDKSWYPSPSVARHSGNFWPYASSAATILC